MSMREFKSQKAKRGQEPYWKGTKAQLWLTRKHVKFEKHEINGLCGFTIKARAEEKNMFNDEGHTMTTTEIVFEAKFGYPPRFPIPEEKWADNIT